MQDLLFLIMERKKYLIGASKELKDNTGMANNELVTIQISVDLDPNDAFSYAYSQLNRRLQTIAYFLHVMDLYTHDTAELLNLPPDDVLNDHYLIYDHFAKRGFKSDSLTLDINHIKHKFKFITK